MKITFNQNVSFNNGFIIYSSDNVADSGIKIKFEEKLNEIREKRNKYLSESDYFILPDYPAEQSEKSIIKEYRQRLRDITNDLNPENIDDLVFPEMPKIIGGNYER